MKIDYFTDSDWFKVKEMDKDSKKDISRCLKVINVIIKNKNSSSSEIRNILNKKGVHISYLNYLIKLGVVKLIRLSPVNWTYVIKNILNLKKTIYDLEIKINRKRPTGITIQNTDFVRYKKPLEIDIYGFLLRFQDRETYLYFRDVLNHVNRKMRLIKKEDSKRLKLIKEEMSAHINKGDDFKI